MSAPGLSVITGACGRPVELQKMLGSVFSDATASDLDIELVIVAANKSPIDNLEMAVAGIPLVEPGISVLVEPRPTGWVRAYNAAAAYARGDAILWINDDCVVLPGTLRACLEFTEAFPGAIGAVAWRDPGETAYKIRDHLGVMYANFGVCRRKLFCELGGFDQRFYSYAADTDLAFTAWHTRPWAVLAVPAPARIDHSRHPGGLRGWNEQYMQADRDAFEAKWRGVQILGEVRIL